jgi:fructose-1,6-bisphosphatase/inositol monophosphatase family enzyme
VAVLDSDHTDGWQVMIGRLDDLLDVADIEGSVGVRDGKKRDTGVDRAGALFVDDDVLMGARDHPVSWACQGSQSHLVGHGAGRYEESGRFAGQLCERLLESVDGRIFAVLVITNLGLGHSPAHLLGRPGDGIGTQVDHHAPTVRYNWRMTPKAQSRFASLDAPEAFGPIQRDSDPLLADLASVALEAAQAAAGILLPGRSAAPTGVETKTSATDMVSNFDREAEAAATRVLLSRRPHDGITAEEGTSSEGVTGVRWIIDPLDGTTNFLFGLPQFAVSVGAQLDQSTVVGVVIDPNRDETWAAVRGGGARLNGSACQVAAGRSNLATALVATGFGYRSESRAWQARIAATVIPAVRDIRRFGSAALDLCWTAAGRYDCYYEWELNPWDLVAGALICAEAGARVEVLPGQVVVAATPGLFDDLVELLASAGGFDNPGGTEPSPG